MYKSEKFLNIAFKLVVSVMSLGFFLSGFFFFTYVPLSFGSPGEGTPIFLCENNVDVLAYKRTSGYASVIRTCTCISNK